MESVAPPGVLHPRQHSLTFVQEHVMQRKTLVSAVGGVAGAAVVFGLGT